MAAHTGAAEDDGGGESVSDRPANRGGLVDGGSFLGASANIAEWHESLLIDVVECT